MFGQIQTSQTGGQPYISDTSPGRNNLAYSYGKGGRGGGGQCLSVRTFEYLFIWIRLDKKTKIQSVVVCCWTCIFSYFIIRAKLPEGDVVLLNAEEAVGRRVLRDDLVRLVPGSVVLTSAGVDEHRVERFSAAHLKTRI